ncbi:hypothetical protein ALC60_07918 [Trachymyrmex zeteki]|uniref:Uncharacterized protein n=1 Tax=Mycetomoellerius zeteki TaxID=64791 RepID=A0A151WZJ9_9HYME|nr:hypothetical protein ALC60_07918 [Trachymyrmex zeteki]
MSIHLIELIDIEIGQLIEINASFPLCSSRLGSPIQFVHDVSTGSELRKVIRG